MEILTSAAAAAIVAGAVTLIQFFVSRKDKKCDKSDERDEKINSLEKCIALLEKSLEKAERDNCRIQMLIMMMHYKNETKQIMKLAEHYFKDLQGDWYMTGIFNNWLVENSIGKPEWFTGEE